LKREAIVKIENVVASVKLNQKIDLKKIVKAFPDVDYRPETFPGVVYKLEKPKTATLIFNSGRMVCTGAKSEREAFRAVRTVIRRLREQGIVILGKPEIKIQNIVAMANLSRNVDLETATYKLRRAIYEPEQFPGIIFKMDEPKVTFLIFSSGKLICAGAKREEEVYEAVEKLHKRLEEDGAIY